jgi:hypothetical protein
MGLCQNLVSRRPFRKLGYACESRDAELAFPISGSRQTSVRERSVPFYSQSTLQELEIGVG